LEENGTAQLSVQASFATSGEGRHYSQRINPVIKGGAVSGAIMVETDVTEQRQLSAEIEIERANSMHAAKFATLGEMAGAIAHEINTPLTTILFLASAIKGLLKRENATLKDAVPSAEKIEITIGRISKIIHGLKAFARESDNDPFAPAQVSEIVENALDLCRHKLVSNGVDIVLKPIDQALTIECRATQVTQIILNLCGNAIDALDGSSVKRIEIEIINGADHIEIALSDSGPGVPSPIREKIMQPFFTTKQTGKGTGLGLSISHRIADQHGGKLYLDSNSPQTRFVVRLPKWQHPNLLETAGISA
jgi:C4-dicarboxylate-specific signal transduction histidine kinase